MSTYKITFNPLSGSGETIEADSYATREGFANFYKADNDGDIELIASFKTDSFASIVKISD